MIQNSYAIDVAWPAILKGLGLRLPNVLRRASLPEDLFSSDTTHLPAEAYFRYWEAIGEESGDSTFALRILSLLRAETFSPPLFAALCSQNLLIALKRLAQYKPLIGPMRLEVNEKKENVECTLLWPKSVSEPPASLVTAELLFFVQLSRMATQEEVRPTRVVLKTLPEKVAAFERFAGIVIRKGKENAISFSLNDAQRPFLSSGDAMWCVFEPELRRRLEKIGQTATTADRVKATLLEALPGGQASLDDVAKRLAISKRTLQRRLVEDGKSYQDVLRDTRLSLAHHYLERTDTPIAEISYLLGFAETNSFFRAFHEWTGTTPEAMRRSNLRGR